MSGVLILGHRHELSTPGNFSSSNHAPQFLVWGVILTQPLLPETKGQWEMHSCADTLNEHED